MNNHWEFNVTTNRIIFLLFFITFAASAHEPEAQLPFERTNNEKSTGGYFHTGWDSRYFSEGRDSLDGDSLWATSIEFGGSHFSGGIWYGLSPDQHYDELQMSIGLTETVGEFELYIAYTHLEFPFDDSYDNEIGIGGSWAGLPLELNIALDGYYSLDVEGSFWEVALNREIKIIDRLTLSGAGIFGVNQGYVSDGHDGANHFAFQISAEYAITSTIGVTAHGTQSWALEKELNLSGDDQLIDFFHAGIGLQWVF